MNLIKLIISILLFFSFVHCLSFAAINGIVIDNTGKPVPGITVVIKDNNSIIKTDKEGRFSADLPSGRYSIEIFDYVYDVLFNNDNKSIITLKTASVTVIGKTAPLEIIKTGKEISQSSGSGISEIMSKEAGVSSVGIGGALSTIAIGGFAKHRIQTRINGFRVAGDRRAGSDLGTVIPALADNVGIFKGGTGSSHGSEAMGGVMDLGLASPDGTYGMSFLSLFSENNNKSLSFFSAKFPSSILSVAFEDAGKYKDADHNSYNGFYSRSNIHFAYKPEGNRFTVVDVFYSEGNDMGKPSTSSDVTVYPDNVLAFAGLRSLGRKSDFQAAIIYQELLTLRAGESAKISSWNFHGTTMYQLTNLNIGLDLYTRQKVNSKIHLTDGISKPVENGERWELSPLISYRKLMGQHFTFEGSARYQYFRASSKGISFDNDITTGSARLKASTKAGIFSTQLFTTYRFPTLDELLYSGLTGRGFIEGNPDLSPEKGKGLSFSWLRTNDLCTLSISYSIQDVDGFIEKIKMNSGVYTYRNLEDVRVQDVSVNIHGKMLTIGASWTKGYNRKTGKYINDIPPIRFTASFTPAIGKSELFSRIELRDNKSSVGSGETERSSWAVIDLGWSYKFSSALQLSLKITNATNQLYWSSADDSAVPSPGRNISFSVKYNWSPKK